MKSNLLHRTCGAGPSGGPGTWAAHGRQGRIRHPLPVGVSHYRMAAMHFPTGYNILVWLFTHLCCVYSSRRTIQFSCGITTILGRLYSVGPAMPCSTGHAILYRLFANIYRRANVPRARVPRANVPRANVLRINTWINCVPHLIPPTGHMKLHTNYIYQTSKLHTNYIYRPELYM